MSRSRPTSSPLSFHKPTGQYYITRNRKRIYLGADRDETLKNYYRLALGLVPVEPPRPPVPLTAQELANRVITAQEANWACGGTTLQGYENWLGRFLADHPGLQARGPDRRAVRGLEALTPAMGLRTGIDQPFSESRPSYVRLR